MSKFPPTLFGFLAWLEIVKVLKSLKNPDAKPYGLKINLCMDLCWLVKSYKTKALAGKDARKWALNRLGLSNM